MKNPIYRLESIEVKGIVQGVGFRPFVHNLAKKHHLAGYVLNSPDGVSIEVEGEAEAIERFINSLLNNAPPLSMIVEMTRQVRETYTRTVDSISRYSEFEIRHSVHIGRPVTLISPDVCICEDCLIELFDRENRRYLYPFINCTNCGPRFTIIKGLPYDRPYTTMSGFPMCPSCRSEYEDHSDRRFHAQPNACPVCGPNVELLDSKGIPIPGNPVVGAVELLKDGLIVAIKGLGGFHLAVDGTNNDAVQRLRLRKHREEKPLALMIGTKAVAYQLLTLGKTEEQILFSRERPIVLAPLVESVMIADAVAPDNDFLGVMFPYTPLHYLLFFHPDTGGNYAVGKPVFTALVMTSGNISEEPICRDNTEALKRLDGIADAFLVHNRDIHVRCDDSVVTVFDGKTSFMRRSRGYVPVPIFLPYKLPSVLALGGELKNTICITEGQRAFTSQYIGDLENIATLDTFHKAVSHLKKILDIEPRIFAYDLHPEYLSTKYLHQLEDEMEENAFCSVGVQHHHAHIASILAENGQYEPVIGLSLDGTGYGLDDTIWGGEVLLCTPYSFTRAGHLEYIPLPGGVSAIREPWRMAFAYLRTAFDNEWKHLNLQCLKQVSLNELTVLDQACTAGVNAPLTSSMGRLFDAVSSIIGCCHVSTFEGQAAYLLEMLARKGNTEKVTGKNSIVYPAEEIFPYTIRQKKQEIFDAYPVLRGTLQTISQHKKPPFPETFTIDYLPLIRTLTEQLLNGKSRKLLALNFHTTIMLSLLDIVDRVHDITGLDTVALSGGCWQNRILSERFPELLRDKGYKVLQNRLVPPNDGGISLGQAFIAANIANITKE